MRFSPPLLPTVLALPLVVTLVGLGNWQVRRNGETAQEVAELTARLEAPPVSVLSQAQAGNRALLLGEWDGRVLLAGRVRFDQLGYEVFQALELDEGGAILVDRGWVPAASHDAVPVPAGPGQVAGLLRETAGPTSTTAQPPQPGIPELWPLTATAAMAGVVAPGQTALYLHAGEPLPPGRESHTDTLPVGGYYAMPTRRPHLAYAATWYSSAGFVLVIWVVLGLRRGRSTSPPR